MLVDHFPLVGLRLITPRLELRLPSSDELAELADLAAAGVHDADSTPFIVPWTDGPPAEVARNVIQYYWRELGAWSPNDWSLNFTVFRDGAVVGQQTMRARDFAITRQVRTGSWLGRRYQGEGVGTEMRAAVLHLAFAGLDADEAMSGALAHNATSLSVSRKLGYEPNGSLRHAIRGAMTVEHRLRLTREGWRRHRAVPVTVDGLAPCLPLLGIDTG